MVCAGKRERIQVHGTRWVAMYLPVWLYSYYHEKGGKSMVHYIAVNGRTGEVMGSVPVSRPGRSPWHSRSARCWKASPSRSWLPDDRHVGVRDDPGRQRRQRTRSLAIGPAGAGALYFALWSYYRNSGESHSFERVRRAVTTKPVTGQETKVDTVTGTKATRINGDNSTDFRQRVQRFG